MHDAFVRQSQSELRLDDDYGDFMENCPDPKFRSTVSHMLRTSSQARHSRPAMAATSEAPFLPGFDEVGLRHLPHPPIGR
jgi:hypothetical protein